MRSIIIYEVSNTNYNRAKSKWLAGDITITRKYKRDYCIRTDIISIVKLRLREIAAATISYLINVLEYLSYPRLGWNRKLLLQLYKSLVRSQLDRGAPVYYQARKSTIKLLDTIQSASLKLSLGTFRTSPHLSLCAEAAKSPLLFHTLTVAANFLASSAQIPQLSIYIRSSSHSKLIFIIFPKLIPSSQLNHQPLHGYSFLQLLDSI